MASGDPYSKSESQVHTSDLDVTQDGVKTTGSGMSYFSFPSQTKLLVRGYDDPLAIDDLWQMFSLYGEVSNIIIEGHRATITFKDHCNFPGLESFVEMEMIIGDRKVLVTNVSMMDAHTLYHPPQVQEEYQDYTQYQPQQMSGGQEYPPSYAMYPSMGQSMYYPPPLYPVHHTPTSSVHSANHL